MSFYPILLFIFVFLGSFYPTEFLLAEEKTVSDPFQEALSNLNDKNPSLRRQAAETFGRLRNPAATDALLKAIADPVPYVRSAAVEALGLMRVQSASSEIEKVLLADKDPGVRQSCAIALGYIANPSSVQALIKGIKDSHEGTRFACMNSLAILRDGTAIEPLLKELQNPDARMRNSSAYALGNIGHKSALPYLLVALKIARATAPALGSAGYVDASVGAIIVRSLGLIGDPSVIPALKDVLKDRDKKVALNVSQALLKLGDKSGVEVARALIKDPDPFLRRVSVELLGDLGDSKDLENLKKMKTDPDISVQQAAAGAIEKIAKRVPVKSKTDASPLSSSSPSRTKK